MQNLAQCARLAKVSQMLALVDRRSLILRGGAGSVPLSLSEVGDALGAFVKDRGTTKHNLTKCGRHPKVSQVLAQVGRGSLGTVPDAPGWREARPPQLV